MSNDFLNTQYGYAHKFSEHHQCCWCFQCCAVGALALHPLNAFIRRKCLYWMHSSSSFRLTAKIAQFRWANVCFRWKNFFTKILNFQKMNWIKNLMGWISEFYSKKKTNPNSYQNHASMRTIISNDSKISTCQSCRLIKFIATKQRMSNNSP